MEMIEITTTGVGINSADMTIDVRPRLGTPRTCGLTLHRQMTKATEMNIARIGIVNHRIGMIDTLVNGDMLDIRTNGVETVMIGFIRTRTQISQMGIISKGNDR